MGPFFVVVYSLISDSESTNYKLIILNLDQGVVVDDSTQKNYGSELLSTYTFAEQTMGALPFEVELLTDRKKAENSIKNKHADALIIIDSLFSSSLEKRRNGDETSIAKVEFVGDLTHVDYLISAVWANEIINEYALIQTGHTRPVMVNETALGRSGLVDEFNMIVPGILIIAIIMLMFTASIAFVSEVENKTILRLKLSKLKTFEYLAGISIVQLMIGIIAAFLTLYTAVLLGFDHAGNYFNLLILASLTSLSIIAFSLILAAVTKSAREILVVGNFPMFLFMFFTGAAFPINSKSWFIISDYPVNLQSIMSPTHATSALKKILIMKMDLQHVMPEVIAILLLTVLYFLIGGWLFRKRHLKP